MVNHVFYGPPPRRRGIGRWILGFFETLAWGVLVLFCPPIGIVILVLKLIENAAERGARRARS